MIHDLLNKPFQNDHLDFSNGFSIPGSSEFGVDDEIIYFINNNSEKNTNELTGEEKHNNNVEKETKAEKEDENVELVIDINEKDTQNNGLGRKKKGQNSGKSNHNKFSDDNTRRKVKRVIITILQDFINKKIEFFFGDDIGEGMIKKKLMKLCQEQISNASIEYNQLFLSKNLRNIFSEKVTGRITNFSLDRNKVVIESLICDENEERRNYFRELFNITFLDCLKYFRGDDIDIEYIQGLTKFDDIREEFEQKEGKNYTEHFIIYMQNYEKILNNKKPRKTNN